MANGFWNGFMVGCVASYAFAIVVRDIYRFGKEDGSSEERAKTEQQSPKEK